MNDTLKRIRNNLNLTQTELANLLDIPIKSLMNWEQGFRKPSDYIISLVANTALKLVNEKKIIENSHEQVLSLLTIKEKVQEIVRKYKVDKVFLYGSYVKGEASKDSDIDLYMLSEIENLDYFAIVEDLRNNLNKKVDLLSNKTVKKGSAIEEEINKTGILIYER